MHALVKTDIEYQKAVIGILGGFEQMQQHGAVGNHGRAHSVAEIVGQRHQLFIVCHIEIEYGVIGPVGHTLRHQFDECQRIDIVEHRIGIVVEQIVAQY